MSFPFNPASGLIIVPVLLFGPSGNATLNLALDTGASRTLINEDLLLAIGYDPTQNGAQTKITTGSKVEAVSLIPISKIKALGQERAGLSVICHTLRPSASVDGLLGLDFFRGWNLNLDFRSGLIALT
jgi:predicted aspartyl protease